MKRIVITIAACATMVAASCQKTVIDNKTEESAVQKSEVTINLGQAATRAVIEDTAEEAKVKSIQIFIFNGEALDAYKSATAEETAALSVEVTATTGIRDIQVYCNAPDLSRYSTKTSVLNAVSRLADNETDSYVMRGFLEDQTLGVTHSCNIDVERYVSRIRINKITRDFSSTALQDADFQIRRIYLTSVVTNILYDGSAPDTYEWINASFGSETAIATSEPFVCKVLDTPAEIANSASHNSSYSFYAYPNTHDIDDTSVPAGFRRTRLVVECQIDVDKNGTYDSDEFFTYPISIGALESNRSYEISELTLTRLGNHSDGDDINDPGEDDDITGSSAQFTIMVTDWTQVLVGESGTVTI